MGEVEKEKQATSQKLIIGIGPLDASEFTVREDFRSGPLSALRLRTRHRVIVRTGQ